MTLSYDEKKNIIRNAEEQLESVVDPLERKRIEGFIEGVWCCIND